MNEDLINNLTDEVVPTLYDTQEVSEDTYETHYNEMVSLGPIFWIPFILILILMIVSMWKVFQKAGEKGWKSIIPIYNTIVQLKIVGKPWWWLLLMLIPCVGAVWRVWSLNMLSKSFEKGTWFTIGLLFLPFIFFPILAFGKSEYKGPYGEIKAKEEMKEEIKNILGALKEEEAEKEEEN